MAAYVKPVLVAVSDSLLAAAIYALIAVGIYAVVFVDLSGRGSLWRMAHSLNEMSQEGRPGPGATRVIKIAARAGVAKVHEDVVLSVFDAPVREGPISAEYRVPEETVPLPSSAVPEPASKRGFTVYGGVSSRAR